MTDQNRASRSGDLVTIHSHGITGYNRHHCRCDICTNAHLTWKQKYNSKKLEDLKNGKAQHGVAAYNCGCRCEICSNAKIENNKKRRKEFKEKKEVDHGLHRYNKYKCRCIICVTANSEYRKSKRVTKQPTIENSLKHEDEDTSIDRTVRPQINEGKGWGTFSEKQVAKRKGIARKNSSQISPEDYLRKSFIVKPDENKPKPVIINEENTGFTIISGVSND